MTIFGVLTERNDKIVKEQVSQINKRLGDKNMVKNPFYGKIKTSFVDDKELQIFYIRPIYFNYSIFGVFPLVFLFLWKGLHWSLIFPILLLACGIFWHSLFYYWMFKLTLRTKGYKGKITKLSPSKVLESIYFSY